MMDPIDASTRLREAIVLNDVCMVKRLLAVTPALLQNPNYEDKSNTSLHLAAKYGHAELAVRPKSHGSSSSDNA